MKPEPLSSDDAARKSDHLRRIEEALRRSALRARRVAAQTGTRLVVVRDGVLVREPVAPMPPEPPPALDDPEAAPGRR